MAARRVTLTAAWKKLLFLRFTLTSLLSASERPNILVLLVDAMSFADPRCHGWEIPTPTLHALAKTGLRFREGRRSAAEHRNPRRVECGTKSMFPQIQGSPQMISETQSVGLPESAGELLELIRE